MSGFQEKAAWTDSIWRPEKRFWPERGEIYPERPMALPGALLKGAGAGEAEAFRRHAGQLFGKKSLWGLEICV